MSGYTIPTTEPAEVYCGDTWQWTRDLADYPAGTWTLRYVCAIPGQAAKVITATASGTTHVVSVLPAATALWTPGEYAWQSDVSQGTGGTLERHRLAAGTLRVWPDPTAAVRDPRSFAERTLAAIEAVIEGRASTDQASMTLDGVALTRVPLDALLDARNRLRAEVAVERARRDAARGLDSQRLVLTHFRAVE